MVHTASEEINWGTPNSRLVYNKNKANNKLYKAMVAMNFSSSPTDEISDDITDVDAAEFISD